MLTLPPGLPPCRRWRMPWKLKLNFCNAFAIFGLMLVDMLGALVWPHAQVDAFTLPAIRLCTGVAWVIAMDLLVEGIQRDGGLWPFLRELFTPVKVP